eukprot:RCo038795
MTSSKWMCLLLPLLSFLPLCKSFSPGDVVPFLERSSYALQATDWHILSPALSPRFGRNKDVRIHSPADNQSAAGDFKIAFALGHDLGWKTPWIALEMGCKVTDVGCLHLSDVELVFTFEKNLLGSISGFKWKPIYVTDHVDMITLHYHWKERVEYDLGAAMHWLYGLSFVGTVLLAVLMTRVPAVVRHGEMLVRDEKSR